MIDYQTGDLFRCDVEALVNPVNCVGAMGKGLALPFKQHFPDNFREYKRACDAGLLKPGVIFTTSLNNLTNPKFIINFPTKRHWRDKSLLADIELGLDALTKEIQRLKISSIAIPPLGCGLGGLDWQKVHPLILSFADLLLDVKILIFLPI